MKIHVAKNAAEFQECESPIMIESSVFCTKSFDNVVQYYKLCNNESMGQYMSHENRISVLSHVRTIVHV